MKKAMKEEMSVLNIQQFPFEEIKRGTFGFHEDCVLGSGGFGTVYKTNLKRTFFAVKKLKPVSCRNMCSRTVAHLLWDHLFYWHSEKVTYEGCSLNRGTFSFIY